ncbi:MAG: hypothetical protein EOQ86_30295 [Mesorhizobium sp.]|uniref:hypothetical protein n=1 Tax=Mesorhizobium sp. TaxID=1871066 RepID=UPI000FE65652|nr:hypothetical protein [Mesorhizobium sp.]RWH69484.1 MAG: hypothetical protein EOQ85_32880 [Mesorhizobium sp.]RWH76350.1 MAG: hypothetical protein EOQ86_30295 [Mesorhizobium sp.]RWH83520.1 MAG: hypothetical protein EOQ87_32705 [Mesorhizobium sp.]RWH91537.1 MAG: hypothetical protein EOQ88_31720 [Mesorhizobium sp.]RWH95810.1 MAG: hypothetical protein EOQ89_30375 [Mesorhizobium sp.]
MKLTAITIGILVECQLGVAGAMAGPALDLVNAAFRCQGETKRVESSDGKEAQLVHYQVNEGAGFVEITKRIVTSGYKESYSFTLGSKAATRYYVPLEGVDVSTKNGKLYMTCRGPLCISTSLESDEFDNKYLMKFDDKYSMPPTRGDTEIIFDLCDAQAVDDAVFGFKQLMAEFNRAQEPIINPRNNAPITLRPEMRVFLPVQQGVIGRLLPFEDAPRVDVFSGHSSLKANGRVSDWVRFVSPQGTSAFVQLSNLISEQTAADISKAERAREKVRELLRRPESSKGKYAKWSGLVGSVCSTTIAPVGQINIDLMMQFSNVIWFENNTMYDVNISNIEKVRSYKISNHGTVNLNKGGKIQLLRARSKTEDFVFGFGKEKVFYRDPVIKTRYDTSDRCFDIERRAGFITAGWDAEIVKIKSQQ